MRFWRIIMSNSDFCLSKLHKNVNECLFLCGRVWMQTCNVTRSVRCLGTLSFLRAAVFVLAQQKALLLGVGTDSSLDSTFPLERPKQTNVGCVSQKHRWLTLVISSIKLGNKWQNLWPYLLLGNAPHIYCHTANIQHARQNVHTGFTEKHITACSQIIYNISNRQAILYYSLPSEIQFVWD